jgi:peptidoglycan/LPS O-acetylase OafA/YrhL
VTAGRSTALGLRRPVLTGLTRAALSPVSVPQRRRTLTKIEDHPATRSHQRISAIDGIRGMAILTVIVGHICRHGIPEGTAFYTISAPLRIPDIGVQVFFVLSGFLITSILAREQDRRGAVSLRAFYARRAYRILPAYAVFLAVMALLAVAGAHGADWQDFASAASFMSDYFLPGETWLVHTWSLSVEEQFYLAWPAVLAFASRATATRVALAIIVASPLLRIAQGAAGSVDMFQAHNRLDQIMIGSLVALVITGRPDLLDQLRLRICRYHAVPMSVIALLGTSYIGEMAGAMWWATFAPPFVGVATAVLVIAAADPSHARLHAFLQFKPLVWVGTISFSLYLWQQIFTTGEPILPFLIGVPVLFAVATLSYYGVERPFLRLKDRRNGVRR